LKHAYGLDIPQTLQGVVDPTRLGLLVDDRQALARESDPVRA
jgi:hypothetical protein